MTEFDLTFLEGTAFVESAYSASEPDILKPHELVRRRPQMYIGHVGIRGLHYLFEEILNNAIDEVFAGHGDRITVTLGKDRSIAITDNGHGIPVTVDARTGKTLVELVMTDLHANSKFGNRGYKTSGGLHSVGASCVNAFSEWMETTVRAEGRIYRMRFERGVVVSPLEVIGVCGPGEQGTTQRWMADRAIFPTALMEAGELDYRSERFIQRIREIAYLTREATITFVDALHDAEPVVFHFPNGVTAYVAALNEGKDVLHDEVIYVCERQGNIEVEIAAQYSRGDEESILAFVSNFPLPEGGTHVTGFKTALTWVVNRYARQNGFLQAGDANFPGKLVRAGVTAVVSVRLPNPIFGSATHGVLRNPELEGIVSQIFGDGLAAFFAANPQAARAIVEKVAATAQKQ